MKRFLVSLCCVLLMVSTIPLLAEEDPADSTTAPDVSTTTTVPTESTTDAEDPNPTHPSNKEFSFVEYGRSYDVSSGVLSVSWNYAEGDGSDVVGAIIDGKSYGVTGSKGRFTVSASLSGGIHTVTYVLWAPDGSTVEVSVDPLSVSGSDTLTIELSVEGKSVVATLRNGSGETVSGYPLQFLLDGNTSVEYNTNAAGQVRLTATNTVKSVNCKAPARTVGMISYAGATAFWQGVDDTNTTTDDEEDDTSTTSRTRWSATQTTVTTGQTKTYATIVGAGTTSNADGKVAVNVTFDEGVVEAFGLEKSDFNERARMLMDPDLYNSLVGGSKATVMMTAGFNGTVVTDQQISQLVSGRSKYSLYDDIQRIPVSLGLQFVDENGKAVPITVAPAGTYTVRLPVPDSMMDCPVLGVAAIDGDKLSGLTDVQVKNGYMEFETNGFAAVVMLGFGHGATSAGGAAWQLILALVVGIVMLIGAGLMMFFFVWRKPKPAEGAPDENTAEKPEEIPAREEPVLSPEVGFLLDQIPAVGDQTVPETEDDGVDLYSSSDRRPQ